MTKDASQPVDAIAEHESKGACHNDNTRERPRTCRPFQPLRTDGDPPYQYVSVEGPITATEVADLEWDLRRLAQRYLGVNTGDRYIEQTRDASAQAGNVLIRMRPERWLTVDYAKAYGTL